MKKDKIKNQREFEERLADAMAYGTPDEVRKLLKGDFKIELNDLMKLTMFHCDDVEDVKILKEMGYDFKDDQKALEEFTRWAALKPEIAQYMIDNGAVISWKAIQKCASRYDIETLKVLVDNKKDFFPID